jgi:HEPN domain-containing protein
MDADKVVQYWVITADDDLRSIRICFRARDYVKALFWGHLYLEKLLKAVITKQTGKHAPYGHALPTLAKKAKLELSKDEAEFLKRVTDYNIKARYPDYEFELRKRATRSFT